MYLGVPPANGQEAAARRLQPAAGSDFVLLRQLPGVRLLESWIPRRPVGVEAGRHERRPNCGQAQSIRDSKPGGTQAKIRVKLHICVPEERCPLWSARPVIRILKNRVYTGTLE